MEDLNQSVLLSIWVNTFKKHC